MKYIIAISIAILAIISGHSYKVSAAAGEMQDCHEFTPVVDVTGAFRTGTPTTLIAQTFTPDSSYSLGAVKFNLYDASVDGVILSVAIRPTDGGAPDLPTSVIAEETLAVDTLPAFTSGDITAQSFSCSKDIKPTQIVEFDPPVSLTSGTTYAIVITHDSGTTGTSLSAYVGDPNATSTVGRNALSCLDGTSCSDTPATWDSAQNGVDLFGFAVFDNVVTPPTEVTFDTWILDGLDTLGISSVFARLVVGGAIVMVFFLVLVAFKVHFLPALAVSGMVGGVGVLITIFTEAMMLSVIAIVGIGVLMLLYRIMNGGTASE